MKTKIAFLAIVFATATIRLFALNFGNVSSTAGLSYNLAGPPTYETTTSGLDIKVWVMTQAEHRKMMDEAYNKTDMNKDNSATLDKGMKTERSKDIKMTGTHHIKVEVTDADNGLVRNDLSAKVEVISPSKKSSWIDLRNMSDHFGSDLSLNEKGLYQFHINIDDKGTQKTTEFSYTVM
jgi:hypothetical protein